MLGSNEYSWGLGQTKTEGLCVHWIYHKSISILIYETVIGDPIAWVISLNTAVEVMVYWDMNGEIQAHITELMTKTSKRWLHVTIILQLL